MYAVLLCQSLIDNKVLQIHDGACVHSAELLKNLTVPNQLEKIISILQDSFFLEMERRAYLWCFTSSFVFGIVSRFDLLSAVQMNILRTMCCFGNTVPLPTLGKP